MREIIINILSNPEFWGLCVLSVALFAHKFWPGSKVDLFCGKTIPALFHEVEQLETDGIITKSDKLGKFIDLFIAAAQSQNIVLTLKDLLQAKIVVTGMAQAQKSTPVLAVGADKTLNLLKSANLEAKK